MGGETGVYNVLLAVQCIYGWSDEDGDGREWRLLVLLYADDLVLWDESEEGLRAVVGRFAEVCRRRGLKLNVGKSKVLNGEEGLGCEVHVDGIRLEQWFLKWVPPPPWGRWKDLEERQVEIRSS